MDTKQKHETNRRKTCVFPLYTYRITSCEGQDRHCEGQDRHDCQYDSIMPNPIGQAVLAVIMYVKTYTTDIIVFIGKVIMWIDLILFMVFNATNV